MSGMIVAPQPEAVEQGAKVLAAGGNAFDAALACAWIQFLVDPHSCGVGGYLLLNCWLGRAAESLPILDAPALGRRQGSTRDVGVAGDRPQPGRLGIPASEPSQ